MNASHLTVRNLPEDMMVALEAEKRRRGTSLNATVIDLLRVSLGVATARRNGLSHLAGTWSEADHAEFLAATRGLEEIDAELWR